MDLQGYTKTDFSDYEKLIGQIMGVIAARVVPDSAGHIAEIHVLAGADRNPKQVVRDIESALAASFAVFIDHKKISVAQLQNQPDIRNQVAAGSADLPGLTGQAGSAGQPRAGRVAGTLRPRLASVGVLTKGRTMEVKVLLEIDGVLFEGSMSGVRTANNKLRLIATATLNALQNHLKDLCSLNLDDISITQIGGDTVVIVSVSVVSEGADEKMVGTSFIHDDEIEAVAKATLSAVNRRLAFIIRQ